MLLLSSILLFMTTYDLAKDRVESHKLYLLFQVLIPSMSITVVYLIAKKHEASIDLFGPILFGSYGITIYAITSFNLIEMNSIARTWEFALSALFYLLYIGFLNIDFLPHFIARLLLFAVIRIHVGIYRI